MQDEQAAISVAGTANRTRLSLLMRVGSSHTVDEAQCAGTAHSYHLVTAARTCAEFGRAYTAVDATLRRHSARAVTSTSTVRPYKLHVREPSW